MRGNKKNRKLNSILVALLFLLSTFFAFSVHASATDGTIDAVNRYAWTENIGWLDFGTTAGNVHVTDSALTGYAWGENVGWISLNCSNDNSCLTNINYKVSNNSSGVLSGYAWSENVGWINFNPTNGGVTINSSGEFKGYAWGENVGWIVFDCTTNNSCAANGGVDYKVKTDWRPSSAVTCTSWVYSDWGSCSNNQQTRTIVSSSPSGCSGGSPVLTQSCSTAGAGFQSWLNNSPEIPSNGFSVIINPSVGSGQTQGTIISSNRIVTLKFNAGPDIKRMAISTTNDFSDASQQIYQPNIQFDLCSQYGGASKTSACLDGKYTVYVKFYNDNGVSSPVVSSNIILQTNNINPPAPPPVTKPVTNPATKTIIPFTKVLHFGQTNADVKRLQLFLNQFPDTRVAKSGPGSPGKETNIFGWSTRAAVIKFQEKYAKDVLSPTKLTRGTGMVSLYTLKKINELINLH
jgi:hypothetical protein